MYTPQVFKLLLIKLIFLTIKKNKVALLLPYSRQSGRLDSNQRPLAPHASALPGCATSRIFKAINFPTFASKRNANVIKSF